MRKLEEPRFSYFQKPITNTTPSRIVNLSEIYSVIRNQKYLKPTTDLRTCSDTKRGKKLKSSQFDYVTFSGVFEKRSDKLLTKHSGLMTLDFDHIDKPNELKSKLLCDPNFETQLAFVSPSGNGLKWIIQIDLSKADHPTYFKAVSNYIKHEYDVVVDNTGKDVSRACFLPCDPDVYINPKHLVKDAA